MPGSIRTQAYACLLDRKHMMHAVRDPCCCMHGDASYGYHALLQLCCLHAFCGLGGGRPDTHRGLKRPWMCKRKASGPIGRSRALGWTCAVCLESVWASYRGAAMGAGHACPSICDVTYGYVAEVGSNCEACLCRKAMCPTVCWGNQTTAVAQHGAGQPHVCMPCGQVYAALSGCCQLHSLPWAP